MPRYRNGVNTEEIDTGLKKNRICIRCKKGVCLKHVKTKIRNWLTKTRPLKKQNKKKISWV